MPQINSCNSICVWYLLFRTYTPTFFNKIIPKEYLHNTQDYHYIFPQALKQKVRYPVFTSVSNIILKNSNRRISFLVLKPQAIKLWSEITVPASTFSDARRHTSFRFSKVYNLFHSRLHRRSNNQLKLVSFYLFVQCRENFPSWRLFPERNMLTEIKRKLALTFRFYKSILNCSY